MDAQKQYTSVLVAYHAGVARDLPTISPYARELLSPESKKKFSEKDLVRAFRTDPFLCAKLLGVANSVFFNFDHRVIFTLQESIDRVGLKFASSLLLDAPLLDPDIDERQVCSYWAHCMSVAHVAGRVAALTPLPPVHNEVAYLVGLVHDIGYLLELYCSPDMLPFITQQLEAGELGGAQSAHPSHGEELARHWCLPLPAIAAIKTHHSPDACEQGQGRWLSLVIFVSEALAGARSNDTTEKIAALSPYASELGILNGDLAGLQVEGNRVYQDCIEMAEGSRRIGSRRILSLKAVEK